MPFARPRQLFVRKRHRENSACYPRSLKEPRSLALLGHAPFSQHTQEYETRSELASLTCAFFRKHHCGNVEHRLHRCDDFWLRNCSLVHDCLLTYRPRTAIQIRLFERSVHNLRCNAVVFFAPAAYGDVGRERRLVVNERDIALTGVLGLESIILTVEIHTLDTSDWSLRLRLDGREFPKAE